MYPVSVHEDEHDIRQTDTGAHLYQVASILLQFVVSLIGGRGSDTFRGAGDKTHDRC